MIVLNEGECRVAKVLAKLRYEANRNGGVYNQKIGAQSDEFTDLEGIAGELAFCKMLNIFPDMSIEPRAGSVDCILPSGVTIDVKTTKYPSGKLTATMKKKVGDVDIYALMVGEFPSYRYAGYARASDLINESCVGTLGHGPTYILGQGKLIPAYPKDKETK